MQLPSAGRIFAMATIFVAIFVAILAALPEARAQQVDCARLQQMIAQDRGGGRGNSQAMRRQQAEIARTQAALAQLGCGGGFSFFGGNPQCSGLNARLQGLQSGLQQLQAGGGGGGGGGGGRGDLVARFNAYCRGGEPQAQSQSRGFFESLFGGPEPRREPVPQLPPDQSQEADDDGVHAHGGSQAVCVRTCDGGFFPLGISARRGKENLTEMCQALCPGTETAVYTRSPDSDIKTAVSLDGKAYMDMPNALKFQKNFSSACACRQAGKSWAETLANAEEVLGSTRKGDIVVTQQKSDELSRAKPDGKSRAALSATAPTAAAEIAPADAARLAGAAADGDMATGSTDAVRRVGPRN